MRLFNRRHLLAMPLGALAAQSRPAPPNVVVLLADDLGWADAGFHGSEIRTPAIDRLAREGVQLDRFYSCPVCSPTRSALMTGRYPIRFGVQYTVVRPWEQQGVPLDEHLMPETFLAAGYQTAMAGKWHLGHSSRRFFPGARGFQSSYGHFNGAIDYFTHVRDGGLDWHRDGRALREPGYSTELIGAEAVRRIRERDKSRPFFLYVPFNAPHSPLQAPQSWIDRYASITDKTRRVFAAMVEAMDAQVGAILDELDRQGIARNTAVLFFSDNGGPANLGARNQPLRAQKATTFEGGIRVPAVLRFPARIPADSKTAQRMFAMDVFPTLASAAGLKPAGKLPLDGRNLWPQLASGKTVEREDLFLAVESGGMLQYAAFRGPWKLVQHVGVTSPRRDNFLFRIDDDPAEANDLAAAHPEVVRDLDSRLERWKALHPPAGLRITNAAPPGWKAPAEYASGARP